MNFWGPDNIGRIRYTLGSWQKATMMVSFLRKANGDQNDVSLASSLTGRMEDVAWTGQFYHESQVPPNL